MAIGSSIGSALGQFGGSFVPIPGASYAGSALGGLLGSYFDQPQNSLFNQPQQQFSPQQQQIQNQAIAQVLSLLQGKPSTGFQPFANQARTQFQQQTVPTLAERFTALGGSSRLGSSAFQGALGSAGAGLEQGLAGLGSQYNQNQLNQLLPLTTSPQFSNYTTRTPGFGENLLMGSLQSVGPVLELLAALYGNQQLNNYFNPVAQATTVGAK